MKKRYQKVPSNQKERISRQEPYMWFSMGKSERVEKEDIEEKAPLEINSFKDVFTFPLKLCHSKVMTADFNMAFDFILRFLDPEAIQISDEDKQKIVDIINGENRQIKEHKLEYQDGDIKLNGKPFIMIRGWGHLTGTGGLNLPGERAKELQDEFGNYIIEKLTKIN
jgi:hypothetical protein